MRPLNIFSENAPSENKVFFKAEVSINIHLKIVRMYFLKGYLKLDTYVKINLSKKFFDKEINSHLREGFTTKF
ncbi:hypothetical protein ACA30_17900 [Virgibacillus soli]|uniref:Uncharacterized protein n=1 Tax=Lederbergia galactosidilytica TaxID=217031 RepID=A0A0Q9Y0X2_9BACI|nr:hypothetical protein ACA30_17900 [Virgibacillus soli]KRG14646.1 hypothetical protein ACA29_05775 [Lederbergia galactosidilytica]OAK70538.1 hypothetical protein ABB05_12335 [Lederbergia galactosidilytica]